MPDTPAEPAARARVCDGPCWARCCVWMRPPWISWKSPRKTGSGWGRLGRQLRQLAERHTVVLHGLSLDIGGPDPLDTELVRAVGVLAAELGAPFYSEHLSYCGAGGHLYDLLPIPFTEEAVHYVAGRVRQVQDILGQPLVLENASYYAQSHCELSESQFIGAVLAESGCELLLDVNNVYVNAINHRYDPLQFLDALPLERTRYIHIAGHYDEADDLKVDTHGADVIDPVWSLLAQAYRRLGPLPTLLERDFNLPPLADLLQEVDRVLPVAGGSRRRVAGGGAGMSGSALRASQLAMAACLRDPATAAAPPGWNSAAWLSTSASSTTISRVFISKGFPSCAACTGTTTGQQLVRGFIREHRCGTPYFLEISQEFLHYLLEEHRPRPVDPPS